LFKFFEHVLSESDGGASGLAFGVNKQDVGCGERGTQRLVSESTSLWLSGRFIKAGQVCEALKQRKVLY